MKAQFQILGLVALALAAQAGQASAQTNWTEGTGNFLTPGN